MRRHKAFHGHYQLNVDALHGTTSFVCMRVFVCGMVIWVVLRHAAHCGVGFYLPNLPMKKHLKAFCLIRSIKQPSQILLRCNHKYFNIIISCQTLLTLCSVLYSMSTSIKAACACIKKKLILPRSLLLYVEHKFGQWTGTKFVYCVASNVEVFCGVQQRGSSAQFPQNGDW